MRHDAPYTVVAHVQQVGHGRHRHLAHQRDHEGFEALQPDPLRAHGTVICRVPHWRAHGTVTCRVLPHWLQA